MPAPKRSTAPSRAQKKKATKAAVTRRVREWWQHSARKLSGLRLCRRCDAVYYDGHWHTAPLLAEELKSGRRKGGVRDLCNECRYAVHGPAAAPLFEGQLTLDGVGDPAFKAKLLSAVRAFGRRATRRDPEDRILTIDDRGDRVVVFTSENQMAIGLGKAIDAAFKGGTLRIAWSDGDLPARAYWKPKA